MTTRSPNLLLDNGAQPAAGVQYANVINWYGGQLSLAAEGVFGTATFQVLITTEYPVGGVVPNPPSLWIADAAWVPLGAVFSAPGRQNLGYINPCLLCINVLTPGSNTRAKVAVV
jgi:hypothetical protein